MGLAADLRNTLRDECLNLEILDTLLEAFEQGCVYFKAERPPGW